MLTFIDKNEVYSDRKFDEVSSGLKYSFIIHQFINLCLWQFPINFVFIIYLNKKNITLLSF